MYPFYFLEELGIPKAHCEDQVYFAKRDSCPFEERRIFSTLEKP